MCNVVLRKGMSFKVGNVIYHVDDYHPKNRRVAYSTICVDSSGNMRGQDRHEVSDKVFTEILSKKYGKCFVRF